MPCPTYIEACFTLLLRQVVFARRIMLHTLALNCEMVPTIVWYYDLSMQHRRCRSVAESEQVTGAEPEYDDGHDAVSTHDGPDSVLKEAAAESPILPQSVCE